jgi:hypothetical protein
MPLPFNRLVKHEYQNIGYGDYFACRFLNFAYPVAVFITGRFFFILGRWG